MKAITILMNWLQILMVCIGFLASAAAWGRVKVEPVPTSRSHETVNYDRDLWRSTIKNANLEHSKMRFIENTASGLAIFAVGTYGSKSTKAASFTTSVYSFLQTGGIFLVSNGIRDYMAGSIVVDMDRFFVENDELSKSQMRALWLRQNRKEEFATVVADLFMWSSLGAIYLNSALNDSSLSTTSRSIYFFLATNSVILSGVAAYKYFNFSQETTRFSLIPDKSGIALAWNAKF